MSEHFENSVCYAVKHKDLRIRMASRSGGIFTALSDVILENQGVVYGCAMDEHLRAVHMRSDTPQQRDRFRGSKYVQSDMGLMFEQVLDDLETGREVLFSGTPCQVAGLNRFLRKQDTNRLLTVEVLCHGVPSPGILDDYLDEFREHGKVQGIDFRNKIKFGWEAHKETVYFGDSSIDDTIYTRLFYSNNIMRPACHICPYKNLQRPADITIGDCWGAIEKLPEFDDNKGVSLVMINSQAGVGIFQKVQSFTDNIPIEIQAFMQRPLIKPYPAAQTRESFWIDYHKKPFAAVAKQYTKVSFTAKIKWHLHHILENAAGRKR